IRSSCKVTPSKSRVDIYSALSHHTVALRRFRSMSTSSSDLAVAMTACNSMRTIERAVRSVHGLAKRIVVVDSGSTDGTVEMCRALGAEVIHQEWLGHVAQRQFSIDQCCDHEWILALDSDESLEPPLRESIRQVVETNDPSYDGWLLNRK